jgi:hypothetical protein
METKPLCHSSRRQAPDLRLRVIRVLHIPCYVDLFQSASARQFGLTVCGPLVDGGPDTESENQLCTILLLFNPSPARETGVGSMAHLQEDRHIFVWQPWYEVDVPMDYRVTSSGLGESTHQQGLGVTLLCSRFLIL